MISPFQILGVEWLFLLLGFCLLGFVAFLVGVLWMYKDAQSRRMDAAVWVVLLVIASLFASVIGFVIVLVIYLVVRESHPVGGGMPAGYGPYPAYVVPAACPVCGRPMTWYPAYGRWYCPSCGQYR